MQTGRILLPKNNTEMEQDRLLSEAAGPASGHTVADVGSHRLWKPSLPYIPGATTHVLWLFCLLSFSFMCVVCFWHLFLPRELTTALTVFRNSDRTACFLTSMCFSRISLDASKIHKSCTFQDWKSSWLGQCHEIPPGAAVAGPFQMVS